MPFRKVRSFAILLTAVIIQSCHNSHTPPSTQKVEMKPPALPAAQSEIAVPAGHTPFLKLLGEGTQVYSCQELAPKQFGWKLDMPDAVLIGDDGQKAGKHYKGPTWEANDGSKVVAALDLAVDAPDPKSAIKWLRLKATTHDKDGTFAKVSYIQRVQTVGGLVPTETCDAKRIGGATVPVPYKSDYYFYAAAQ